MYVLLYPGLRHCGNSKPLKPIWGWSGWICWSGKELWEISQDSCRRLLEWHHNTFWLFLSHSKLRCSVFLTHLYVKYLLEAPEEVVCAEQGYLFLKEAGAVTQGMMVVQQCHFRGRAELHQGVKFLTLPKSDVGKCNFLCSAAWWEGRGSHTEKDEKWENQRRERREKAWETCWCELRRYSEHSYVSG